MRMDRYLYRRKSTVFQPMAAIGKFSDYEAMSTRTFAQRLQAVIDADPKLTAAGLATQAGLNNSAIRYILNGRVQHPRLDTAEKICRALGTTYNDFMSDELTSEEAEILSLLSELPDDLRRQLLGYGQALRDAARKRPNSEAPEEDQ